MKKQTDNQKIISLLTEIRDSLQAKSEVQTAARKDIRQIVDDGTKKTSELLKAVGDYWSWHTPKELDVMFPPVKTARYFKWQQESDQELKGKSANDLGEEGLKDGITVREWLIFEALWFKENGTHLDEIGWTLCAGSRYAAGSVPNACWHRGDRRAGLGGSDPSLPDGVFGARSAVRVD